MPFRIHGQDLLFDILTDAGLVLFQKLRFKFTLPVTGNKNLDFAETGPQIFAAVAVPTVVRSLVLVVVFAVAKILIQFSLQTILHEFGNGFLEQVLDLIHAVDVCHLQQFMDLCSTGVFFRASILSGHIFFLHPDASILHLSGGLHNYWDGLAKTVQTPIFWGYIARETERSRRGTPCCTYRYRTWILQGASGWAHPVFVLPLIF